MSRRAPAWARVAVRCTVLALFALVLLLGTSMLCALAISFMTGGSLLAPANVSIGLICSLIVWLFVATFHLRKETVTLAVPDRAGFLHNARTVLTEMGYDVSVRGPLQLSTRPRFQSMLVGGGVEVAVTGTHAHLTGPKVCVEILRNRLRIQSHLARCRQSLREQRFSEALVKRAELRLRVKPEDLPAIQANVIDVLQASSEVVCDVYLLAQSEAGIPESVLEFQINEWLAQQGIEATLHKHFIQLHRPLTSAEVSIDTVV